MSAPKLKVCLIEDDAIIGDALEDRFALEGFECVWFRSGSEALLALARRRFDIVLSDIHLPDMSGEDVYLGLLGEGIQLPPYIFITGYGEIDQAVRLLKRGAADYITKPFDIEALLEKIGLLTLPAQASADPPVLGTSPAMRALEAMLVRLGASASNVLITGESGVGKEEVARTLHRRREGGGTQPFVAVNCGAITESLMEAELFGHEKGAFTGAARTRRGVFEQADGGTLFLDEIGDMPLAMQVRLLRATQERRITRVGGETPIPVHLHLVCATHQDLRKMVERGEFREDLYYRINVVHLRVPPLRERPEDVLWLARRFLDDEAAARGGPVRTLSPPAERAMLDYPWPGNIRELKHAIERASVMAPRGPLQPESLFEEVPAALATAVETLADHLKVYERQYIVRVLAGNGGHIGRSAAALGISRKNLWERMKRLDIPGAADN